MATMNLSNISTDDPFIVHICKDKTFSIRAVGDKVFNGAALPVISCRSNEEAEALQIATCAKQYVGHPDMAAGEPWYRLNSGEWGIFSPPDIEVEELEPIADYLAAVLARIRNREGGLSE